jgi:hypothetical protein
MDDLILDLKDLSLEEKPDLTVLRVEIGDEDSTHISPDLSHIVVSVSVTVVDYHDKIKELI